MEPSLIQNEWTELDSIGFSALVGPIFWRPENDGRRLYRLDPEERHRNRGGFVHGGTIMTLADIAIANTLRRIGPDFSYKTIQMDVYFMAPARLDLPLICECVVRKCGQQLAFVDASFVSGEKPVAKAQSIWSVVAINGGQS